MCIVIWVHLNHICNVLTLIPVQMIHSDSNRT